MIICTEPQGSQEWLDERSGTISASNFLMVRTKVNGLDDKQRVYVQALLDGKPLEAAKSIAGYKSAPTASAITRALDLKTVDVGEWSDKAKNYAFRLACERIAGKALPSDTYETFAMQRGRELEEACRLRHEADIGGAVDLASFVKTEDGKFGCTPDGLIDDDGGCEYKAFYAPEKVRPILIDNDWGDVVDQVQGSLWLTGRKWWDMCLYFPSLASEGKDYRRVRVTRDEAYIENLEKVLVEFDRLVVHWEERIRAA